MNKFAKLFDVGEHQLLVFTEPDQESDHDDYYVVHQIISFDGAIMDMSFGGPMKAMDKLFDFYDQAAAEKFFTLEMVKIFIADEATG